MSLFGFGCTNVFVWYFLISRMLWVNVVYYSIFLVFSYEKKEERKNNNKMQTFHQYKIKCFICILFYFKNINIRTFNSVIADDFRKDVSNLD